MRSRFVLRFEQIKDRRAYRSQVGGKGYALARLREAGFPVPSGFVVTADAYRTFVAANELQNLIADALADGDPAIASVSIQAALEEAEVPTSIAAAIRGGYLALEDDEVAVRSSALAEDGGVASFAGQHETFLRVIGEDEVLTAIRRCWASLWSERAMAYRGFLSRTFTGPESEIAMAVVVQRMVSAAQAGVAFTIDPISGRRDVIVIEAVAGLGDGLVGGEVSPHRYVVQRGDCCAEPFQEVGVLDNTRLKTVVCLAREVESWAGEPQDLEWALDEAGCIHLLQARPITGVSEKQFSSEQPEPREVMARWTRDNVGEVIPDPVTPLSWSVLDPLGNRSFAMVLRRLGVKEYPEEGLFGRFYGRVYFNQTLFQGMMNRFYPSHAGWRVAPRLTMTALRALLLLLCLSSESEGIIDAILEQHRAERELDLASLPVADVLGRLACWRRLGIAAMEIHLAVSVVAELLYQTLDKLLERWSDTGATATALAGGLKGIRSAEAGYGLAALARQICQDDELRKLVLTASPETLACRLAEVEVGQELLTQIKAFLVEHGHSASQEFELAVPRWRDEPAIIMNALQVQVRAASMPAGDDPVAARLAAVARVERGLGLVKRWILYRGMNWVQRFTVMRENLKYHFVIAHSRLRDLYLILAGQLVAAGYLIDSEDIFFLTAEEVTTLIEGGLRPGDRDVGGRVSELRRTMEIDRLRSVIMALDQWTDGRLVPVAQPDGTWDGDDRILRGFAASPGSYTGRARVLLSPTSGVDLEPGEVLVATATTPGWAPLLLTAGGLITEIGGTLSHGAIIAREYGLPAVLNVAGATHRIRTGQVVHVDGSRGIVRLEGEVT